MQLIIRDLIYRSPLKYRGRCSGVVLSAICGVYRSCPATPPHSSMRRRRRIVRLPDLPAKSRRIAIINSRTSPHPVRDGSTRPPLRRTIGAAEATYQYSSVTDRGDRMGRAATSPNLKLLLEKETRRCRRL